MLARTLTAFTLLGLASQPSLAGTYEVNVTRKGSNVYRVDGKDIVLHTRYCYVYAYSEESIFKSNGYGGGELIFIDSRDKCDVKAVYGKVEPKPGKYSVRVTHESDDWYEVQGTDTYLQTSMCLSLALGQEAFLALNAGGYGKLVFDDGQSCAVEAVLSKLKLN